MSWTLTYNGFDVDDEGLRETLCTLGNGRFATRGATLDSRPDATHYPGTYLAGGYDRQTSEVSGREIENEDLVNWPNWLPLVIRPEGGDWLRITADSTRDYVQTLDMRHGLLLRELRLVDPQGRVTRLRERRFVSMADPDLAAVELTIVPEGWSGRLDVRSAIHGGVTNWGVERYRDLEGCHLRIIDCAHPEADVVRLHCRTLQSRIEAVIAARTRLFTGHVERDAEADDWRELCEVGTDFALDVADGEEVSVEKIVSFATSRDCAIASPSLAATDAVILAPRFAVLLEEHERAWRGLWEDFDIALADGDDEAQQHLRVNTFHLLQSVSPHTTALDVGAPARGWHGEAYRGHIFWDELFVFRVLNLREPRWTRALLSYRLRRLEAARRLARSEGLPGAMYPWQSGSDGREESQVVHLNPKSGRWVPDATHRQRHIGLALAYNIWTYFRATDDRAFLAEGGAEMLLEIARFFAGLASWDDELQRYRIRGVMGPDEFHTAYPGVPADEAAGIDDNAYTNVLTSWLLTRTIDALSDLPPSRRQRLRSAIGLDDAEIARWQEIAEKLYVPHLSNGLIAQFEGYEDLEELDWDAYRERYDDIHRLDRILEAEGKDVNDYKVSKQADVLMLPFLFSSEELVQIFERMGYVFDPADIPRLVAYYDQRTSHGSTLSRVVHAWVVGRSQRPRSWDLLREALEADVKDVQGGSTREGIHLGAMCGTIDMIQAGYLGLVVRSGILHVDPVLPDALSRVRTRVRYRGQEVKLDATRQCLDIAVGGSSADPIGIAYRGQHRRLPPGSEARFRLVRPRNARAGPAQEDGEP
ncbi:glycoside hydrolase family 65 protein [Roseitranquillus sediminis]|uniref:glycoside hydrolase family 65 protein n=1 Tax=Roseitranquillus sediminis TaxID=2809051 RepID=UPI001D0CD15C|nr:glycosyl hydrolase family 65 protein [Roseitranquillus sediminis]MBM9593106.1 glycoside hydrolase family 65 protein [Roseitranquillus sediminis]